MELCGPVFRTQDPTDLTVDFLDTSGESVAIAGKLFPWTTPRLLVGIGPVLLV